MEKQQLDIINNNDYYWLWMTIKILLFLGGFTIVGGIIIFFVQFFLKAIH